MGPIAHFLTTTDFSVLATAPDDRPNCTGNDVATTFGNACAPVDALPGNATALIRQLLGWMKWGGLIAGIVGLIICGIMMIIGRRGRSQTAVEGAAGIPWVLGGLTLISLAASLVGQMANF